MPTKDDQKMTISPEECVILIAEDDADDYQIIKEALDIAGIGRGARWVKDGVQLMDYLYQRNAYRNAEAAPRPSLIILDLIMPKKSGHEALREIKASTHLRSIPILVLTTSNSRRDMQEAYELGISSLVRKPLYFEDFVDIAKMVKRYWCTQPAPREAKEMQEPSERGTKKIKVV